MKENQKEIISNGKKSGSKDHDLIHRFDDCVCYSKVNVNFVKENWFVPVGTNQKEINPPDDDFFE